ncbi:histone-like nucleoid-structuring protein Lsr2 [Arthrobacter sp. KNU40]|uniref:histone-like nucleoid-structuring protein Lsr2 n=1 Tax=Arthrobacter sp. KNU40 TaxID=3447965 RepID=UPI003F5E8EFA
MTQRMVILLEDDLDGSKASETVSFALDGAEYVIDLNEEHASELRSALAKYMAAGRRAGGRARSPRKVAAGSDTKAIREWARANNIPINSRGRIQAEVMARYEAAQTL